MLFRVLVFVPLLPIVLVAIYKSDPPKEFVKVSKKAVDNDSNLHQLVLLKADDNTLMDAEVSVTCMNLSHARKAFQLGLLCTKHHPSERPTMHEVSRVLVSLLPPPPAERTFSTPPKSVDYAKFVIGKEKHPQPQTPQQHDTNSLDAQWYVRFGEVISNNTV